MAASRNSHSADLSAAVAGCLAHRLAEGRRACVALSGGADSMALLHALVEVRGNTFPDLQLSALHVHHGLSAYADGWSEFCAAACAAVGVRFHCERVSVDRGDPRGLEAAARQARYAAFAGCAADWLLLAHHRDDQAETLLLNLLRGAGVRGLAAMPDERRLAGGVHLLRPFLAIPRAEILDWLRQRDIAWVEDDSNADTALRRNFLRRRVLPVLGESFPDPAGALARAAARLAESSALADEIAATDARVAMRGDTLSLAACKTLSPVRRANLLRHFLRHLGLRAPDGRQLQEMLRQLEGAAHDAAPRFRVDGRELQVSGACLGLRPGHAELPPAALPWRGESRLDWGDGCVRFCRSVGEGLSEAALQRFSAIELRPRRGGELLRPDARRPRRLLKKWLAEGRVPLWQRERMPLLWGDGQLLWAPEIGYATDGDLLATSGVPGWTLSWEVPDCAPAG